MVDLDPKIWENKTLGSASNLPFLDEVSAQVIENQNARREDRDPELVEKRGRFTTESRNIHYVDAEGTIFDPVEFDTTYELTRREEEARVQRNVENVESLQENKETKDRVPVIPEQEEKVPSKTSARTTKNEK